MIQWFIAVFGCTLGLFSVPSVRIARPSLSQVSGADDVDTERTKGPVKFDFGP